MDPLEAIRSTNSDAVACKASAVAQGYLKDSFISIFSKNAERKPPVINRGSYLRCAAIDTIIEAFLRDQSGSSQIVSLGAGSDTRYLTFKERGIQASLYVELDYTQITSQKAMALCKNNKSKSLIGSGGTELIGKDYWLLACDLINFDQILSRLIAMGLDKNVPTLFLSECFLIYLDPDIGNSIIKSCSSFRDSHFVTYEQIGPTDRFGITMLHNLENRAIALQSIHNFPSIKTQEDRYLAHGWLFAKAIDFRHYWDTLVSPEEKERVSKLEIFDEVEEWNLLMAHYCLLYSSNSRDKQYL